MLMLRLSSLLVIQLARLALPPRSVDCQSYESNPPTTHNICIDESGVKYTGYKATRDCRGYVYCNEGVSAGVIPCWPNQLYDTASGVCTYWQNVNAASNACPDLDGTMRMPEITDPYANEQLFYCGVSASNARSVCEPCPGGARLECSDLSHNCFAGITGCKSTNTDADTANNDEESHPTFSIETNNTNDVASSYTKPPDITLSPSLSPEKRNAQDFVILQTAYPTPYMPASAEPTFLPITGSLPPLTGTQVESSQSTTIMIDQQKLLCASTKDELEVSCASAPSCANTSCPSQMFCFAFTCNNNTEAVLTTTAESYTVATSSSIGGGGGAGVVTEEEEGVDTIMYSNPSGNTFFCSETYELLQSTKICLMSKPCPSGIATNSCVAHEGCFSSSSCAAQYESAAAAAAANATVHHLSTTEPSMPPLTIEPSMNPSSVQPSVHHIPTTLLTTLYPSGLPIMIPVSVVDASLPQESTLSPFIIQSTTSPSTLPISLSPIKLPTINTNYCGVTWDDHTRNCDVATPCPKGDECPSGETCFSTSPCGILNNHEKDDVAVDVAVSNVGSFCSKEWNILLSTCMTAARCPIGDECTTDEFCYQDFVCDPPPQHTTPPTIISSIIVSPTTASSVTVDEDVSNPQIIDTQQFFCASTKEELDSSCSTAPRCNSKSCPSEMFCFAFTCADEVLVSSDDKSVPTSLPTNSTISIPNNNFQTWQSDSVIAAGHKPPKKPCDLCSLHEITFDMKSEVEVSYEGITKSCLQVYHLLYTRREESSGHCIDAQRTLFKQCCVRTGTIMSSSPTTMAATTPAVTTNASTSYNSADFETWYTGASMTSASSSTTFTCSMLLVAVWLFALLDLNNN